MTLMLSPIPGRTFVAPSGATYVSDPNTGIIANVNVFSDVTALIAAGCAVVNPAPTDMLFSLLSANFNSTADQILTPTFAGVSYDKLERMGSVQWPCNDKAPEGTPIMHVDKFVRGKGRFLNTQYVPTDEKVTPRFPLLLTTGRILSQYNVGAQTRRTPCRPRGYPCRRRAPGHRALCA